jgi:hypothetical protein
MLAPAMVASSPEALLARLEPGAETPVGAVRGLAAVVDVLAAAGLVTVRKDGRTTLVTLTAAGAAQRGQARGPRARRTTAPSSSTVEALERRVTALEATVAALQEQLLRPRSPTPSPSPAPTPSPSPMTDTVLAAIADLDARLRLGGLVPIPDLRAELRQRGVTDAAAVTATLEALEQSWTIDLSAAQSPSQVADRGAGIERPGRGLLYYITRR